MARFASLNQSEINQIITEKDSSRTRKATEQCWRTFEAYCGEKDISVKVESIEKKELNEILEKFYLEARQPNGNLYKKSSLQCLRFGINRKIKSVHKEWDIIHDIEFTSSNISYAAQITNLKKNGLAKVEHYPPINADDMKKIYESGVFNLKSPKGLQLKVFFELVFYLCRRGEENLRNLTKAHFMVKKAPDGSKYIEKVIDELDKNHRSKDEAEEGGIIQERPEDPLCPVLSFELYIEKLNPKLDALFQRPKESSRDHGPWYDRSPVGVNTIAKFMKNISKDAGLSREYTNHSIRATTITLLDAAGYEARHITSLTGHKSHDSLRSYCKTSVSTKRKMSEVLSLALNSSGETSGALVKRNFNLGLRFDEQNSTVSSNIARFEKTEIDQDEKAQSSKGNSNIQPTFQNNTNCTFNINF